MNTMEIIKRLTAAGNEAFVIGGAVRDKLMGLPIKDEDIVTNARPREIISLFQDCKVSEVGKAFGVVLVNGIEVATYRQDRYEGYDDKVVSVSYTDSLREDVARRDLTINTLAENPLTGEIIDHFGGRQDLEDRIVRFVGNPMDRIKEDPNRILRACRFAAKINGEIEQETLTALKVSAEYVREFVAPERIRKEILSAMEIPRAGKFFCLMQEIGVLRDILPSLNACVGHDHGLHHTEDVFTHQMISGDQVSSRRPLVKLAAYLHDVGKPGSYDPVSRTFYDHEKVGAEILAAELPRLKFSNEEVRQVVNMVKHHMLIHFEHPTPKAVRRVLRKLHEDGVPFRDALALYDADLVGNEARAESHLESRFANLLAAYRMVSPELHRKEPVHSLAHLKLNGTDVCRIANIKPSEKVGEILQKLLGAVTEDPAMNNPADLTRLVLED